MIWFPDAWGCFRHAWGMLGHGFSPALFAVPFSVPPFWFPTACLPWVITAIIINHQSSILLLLLLVLVGISSSNQKRVEVSEGIIYTYRQGKDLAYWAPAAIAKKTTKHSKTKEPPLQRAIPYTENLLSICASENFNQSRTDRLRVMRSSVTDVFLSKPWHQSTPTGTIQRHRANTWNFHSSARSNAWEAQSSRTTAIRDRKW